AGPSSTARAKLRPACIDRFPPPASTRTTRRVRWHSPTSRARGKSAGRGLAATPLARPNISAQAARGASRQQKGTAMGETYRASDSGYFSVAPEDLKYAQTGAEGMGLRNAIFRLGEVSPAAPVVVMLYMPPNAVLPRHAH